MITAPLKCTETSEVLLGWQLVPARYKGRRKKRQKRNSQHRAKKE